MAYSALDFLLENLMQLINCNNDNIMVFLEKDQIESLYEEMKFMHKFLKDSEKNRYEHDLEAQIRDVAHRAEDIVDLFVSNAFMLIDRNLAEKVGDIIFPSLKLSGLMEEVSVIKSRVMEIYDNNLHDMGFQQIGNSSYEISARTKTETAAVEEETMVGFDENVTEIKEQLTGESAKQLEVLSIVGMAGLGKTTLARKVYNDAYIVYHFYIRAWTNVSQSYQKRDLLLGILSSSPVQLRGDIYTMDDEMLGEHLYKSLKGKRYLIVMDDIWNISAWYDLKMYFPNDKNGSRILFTTRLIDVAYDANPCSPPYCLRFLTKDESWDLLRQKVFQKKNCPPELMEIGKRIAKKCRGLPLAVLVVAGLLTKNERTEEWWSIVAKSLSSYIVSDPEQYMDTLALSYNHLPHHLKACFLYFGSFPEDYEIPVWKLICLWVAEGFIQQNEQNNLEEIAEDYLMDLIDRSLIVISERRTSGGIKTCRIHDLLRDLCLRKAEEENFLQQISWYGQASSSFSLSTIANKKRRLCIHSHVVDFISSNWSLNPHALHVRSLLFFGSSSDEFNLSQKHLTSICQAFKLLRVVDLSPISIMYFPHQLEQLVHLRYLALKYTESKSSWPSIPNLWNLETLIVKGFAVINLSEDIWKLVKLRHLYIDGRIRIHIPLVTTDWYYYFSILDKLRTIGNLDLISCGDEKVLAWIPYLKKLKCYLSAQYNCIPQLDFLLHLETLKLTCYWFAIDIVRPLSVDIFPPNLKKLTLSFCGLPWTEMSILGNLPNLEVLKLLSGAFKGPRWDTNDEEFGKLKYLKFHMLDIVEWDTCSNHFPNLERLVLNNCEQLKEIPCDLGDISTLHTIELYFACPSAAASAMEIRKEQWSNGNDGLKVIIYPRDNNVCEEISKTILRERSMFSGRLWHERDHVQGSSEE